MFHLFVYITIKGETWKIEKNEVVTLTVDNKKQSDDCIEMRYMKKKKLGDFMKSGEKFQTDFWNYNARTNNCQDFAVSLLVGNNIIKKNSKIYKFIKQDAAEVFRRNPQYFDDISVTVMNIAGILDIIKNGFK